MRIRMWVAVILVLIATLPLYAETYSADDLWILEIIVNEDMASCQVTDALIIEEQVFLPLTRVAGILKIPLNIDHSRRTYAFIHPGTQAPVVVEGDSGMILVDDVEVKTGEPMYTINGELFLTLSILSEILDSQLTYVSQHLLVYLETTHLAKREESRSAQEMVKDADEQDVPAFSISNIKYRWTAEWEKQCGWLKVAQGGGNDGHESNGDDGEQGSILHHEEEDWGTRLQVDMKGTLYDWEYQLGGEVFRGKNEPLEAELTKYFLTYDMDFANFSVGKLGVTPENQLNIKNSVYDGVALVSKISPVYRMNGNLVQITGEAPQGSKVKLFVNKWLVEEQVLRDESRYLFKDVLLSYGEMVNEIRVNIKKPGGEVEEIFRYVSVSEALLNKGEVDYLVQAGKFKTEDCEGNYLLNSIVYWGVTKDTTIGVSWYGEMKNKISCIEQMMAYNYNSLRFNQRISDNLIFKGSLYHTQSAELQDLGYNLSLDYKNPTTQTGLEYLKEARQFKEEENPAEVIRLYFIQSLEPNGILEGQTVFRNSLDQPDPQQQHWEVGYKTGEETWESSVILSRDVFQGAQEGWQNQLNASLGYIIRPNLKMLQTVTYKAKWDQMLKESVGAGIQGLYELNDHQFVAGLDWSKDITDNTCTSEYSLSWSKRFELAQNQYISTKLGYNLFTNENGFTHTLPLSIRYNYVLPNDARIQLYYEGMWEKGKDHQEVEHKLGFSLEGAFNFFGGKLTSTSPHSGGSKIGMVTGIVFRDSNRNGQFDAGEAPLSGIPVRLGRKIQLTDNDGRFTFKAIPHGVHYLGFDYSQLPIELTPSTADKNVKVEANGVVEEFLGLYVVGVVDGMIYVHELPESLKLHGIKLVATPGGYVTYTNLQGYYYFDQLPPGEYQIGVDPASMPEWLSVGDHTFATVQITDAGEYISGIDFTFVMKPEYLNKAEAEQVEVVSTQPQKVMESEEPLSPETPAAKEMVRETIEGVEEQLIELDDHVLKVDLSARTVTFNGADIELNPFFLMEEQIWAPLRAVAQLFSSRIYWDPEKQRIYIVDQEKNILFDIKLGYLMINGEEQELQHGIRVVHDFTFVSLEDLELIGLQAEIKENTLYIFREE